MNKYTTIAVTDNTKHSEGELDVVAEMSNVNNKETYIVSLGGHRFEFSSNKELLDFRNTIDGVINKVLQLNPVVVPKKLFN